MKNTGSKPGENKRGLTSSLWNSLSRTFPSNCWSSKCPCKDVDDLPNCLRTTEKRQRHGLMAVMCCFYELRAGQIVGRPHWLFLTISTNLGWWPCLRIHGCLSTLNFFLKFDLLDFSGIQTVSKVWCQWALICCSIAQAGGLKNLNGFFAPPCEFEVKK